MRRCIRCIPWYKERLVIIGLVLLAVLVASWVIAPIRAIFFGLLDYAKMIWWALLLGIFIGGLIDRFIPSSYVTKFLATHKRRTILYSVFLGFLMSTCSHGILAISMELYKKGASTPSIISFLLASPWANATITLFLFGFFGIKAFLFIGVAIIIAMITGFIYLVLDKHGLIECKNHLKQRKEFSIIKDIKKRLSNYRFSLKNIKKDSLGVLSSMASLSRMILWWIVIGMLLAAVARAFVPTSIFQNWMGPTTIGLLVTLALATIIEVCSEGSAPIAFEIFKQTGAFGNALVFLMAGVATDVTEIGLIWSNIGRKAALWLPIIVVPQVIVFGLLFNLFL